MNNTPIITLIGLCFLISTIATSQINRKALVERHNPTLHENNPKKPMQVGNGELAFNVDITGLQTFNAHNTMSHWAWHNMPLPKGIKIEDFKTTNFKVNEKSIAYEVDNIEQPELSKWLAANPHPINLGRIGLNLTYKNGSTANIADLKNTIQKLNLWTGIITSTFIFDNSTVVVKTACHPKKDEIGVEINSDLIARGQLKIAINFPYADDRFGDDFVGDYEEKNRNRHFTKVIIENQRLNIQRTLDDFKYFVNVKSNGRIAHPDSLSNPHQFLITPTQKVSIFSFSFSKTETKDNSTLENTFNASAGGWAKYWLSGAAIDFSECTDKRAFELERRVILSQYLMKVNNAGSLPPPESGLLKNNWYGKFHMEMLWWHGVHFALWNRWNELDKMLQVYQKYLPTSTERANKQGFKGARWPKSTGNIDREWPHLMHAFLIWQQPHPIYFADLDYRAHPTPQTLDKWKEVVFATADFMASYTVYDSVTQKFNLNPPLFTASENTHQDSTKNPAFELSYWQYGIKTAIAWREKLKQPVPPQWIAVSKKIAPLPIQENKYVTYEGIKNMWSKYNYEHPCLIATYGMLPGDGVDTTIMKNTFAEVIKTWDYNRTWGWDYPVFAMTAAKLNQPEMAIQMLLHPSEHNTYDTLGYNSWVYLPGNGGLLSAVAMMAGGWDGSKKNAPGFPKNGKWKVKVEGFAKMP